MLACSKDHAVDLDWNRFKSTLQELYLGENLSLEDVRDRMKAHQFYATNAQYELQFKKWNFRKYRTADEWRIVAQKLGKRKADNKESEVILDGKVLNPKKLRKQTQRYGRSSDEQYISLSIPCTPEGFIIRTPSPEIVRTVSTQYRVLPSISPISIQIDWLPFCRFNIALNQQDENFLGIQNRRDFASTALTHGVQDSIVNEIKGQNREWSPRSFNQMIEALVPDNILKKHTAMEDIELSQCRPSPILNFMELTMYLISNNFFEAKSAVSTKVYKWIKRRSNSGLMEYLLSISGPTVDALTENLFQLAIDNEDVKMVQKMLNSGVNPNEQVYREDGYTMAPLERACELQNLELVRILLKKGAEVNLRTETGSSPLLCALRPYDEDLKLKEHTDIELIRILLDAGADVNYGFEITPLLYAAESAYFEAVDLLLSEGADINSMDEFGSTPLIKAVECQKKNSEMDIMAIATRLLDSGADPQAETTYEGETTTLLKIAMRGQNIELIELLVTRGARILEDDFIFAVSKCGISMAKLLLKHGARITNRVIESSFHNKDPMVAFLFLENINKLNTSFQTTAFLKAIETGRMDLVQRLDVDGLQLGRTASLRAAIRGATERGDIRILKLLLDSNSKHRDSCLKSLGASLLTAITKCQDDIVELLLAAGADINVSNEGKSPLTAAICRKDLGLVRKLLAAGAKVNHTTYLSDLQRLGTTSVLPLAVAWGYYPLIQQIVNAGADIDAPESPKGKTALFVAVEKGDWPGIRFLIKAGANVNNPEAIFSGKTALDAACIKNDLDMVRYLLDLGAEPDESSLVSSVSGSNELVKIILAARLQRYKYYSKGYGCRALQYAVRLGNSSAINILLAEGIDPDIIIKPKIGDKRKTGGLPVEPNRDPFPVYEESVLGSAIKLDSSDNGRIVKLLLDKGANPNSIVYGQQTALLAAIGESNLTLIKMLIAAGANPNSSIIPGVHRTPLQLAIEKGRMDIVKILLNHNVDVNAPPFQNHGATALQFAAIGGYVPIAQLLLEKGADVNASAAKIGGRTALEAAAEHGRIDMLGLLLSAGALTTGIGAKQYERACEFAKKNGYMSARRLLEKHHADVLEIMAAWDPMEMDFGTLGDFQF